jgi:cytidylate kinase
MAKRQSNPSFDKEVDRKLIRVAESGNAVITSYTLPWLTKYPVKFWLKGSQDNRARRMANRDNIGLADAKKIIRQRDMTNRKIYGELYRIKFGDDLTMFDFSLNTDLLSLASVIDISKNTVGHLINQ